MLAVHRARILALTSALGIMACHSPCIMAQPPAAPAVPPTTQPDKPIPVTPAQPGTLPPVAPAPGDATAPPAQTAFGTQPEAGGSAVASAAPNMIGDLAASSYARQFVHSSGFGGFRGGYVFVPQFGRGGFKIEENENPKPLDRVFVTYNYFNGVSGPSGSPTYDLHRELGGFEKTFLDGDASIGLRVNSLQSTGSNAANVDRSVFGDMTIITKYALVNDRETGNVFSGGLAITVPTGPSVALPAGSHLNPVLFQPYSGFVYNLERIYALGFGSIIIPTDAREAFLSTSSMAFGYRLYEAANDDSVITSITPTLEGHATFPLSKEGLDRTGLVGFPNIFAVTGGVHVGIGPRTMLTTAMVLPLSGPKPYDFEAVAQLNIRF